VVCWERSPDVFLVHAGRSDGHLVREGPACSHVHPFWSCSSVTIIA
jgi:hypothetical protein